MFSSRNSSHHAPMVVPYYDESLDQDVLRVVKSIRRRAGLNLPPEAKPIKAAPAASRGERRREQRHIQSLPKYNVEVQIDSPFFKEKPSVSSVSITRKFPRKGFRDEFDFVNYEYNDENQLPPKKPTMLIRPKALDCTVPDFIVSTTKKASQPRIMNTMLTVDTLIASQVKDPDSPTRHIQRIEALSGASSTADSPSVFNDVISPISVQPYSFVCSTNIGTKFVTPQKENAPKDANPSILTSFTEATDNESVDLSIGDDLEPVRLGSFWDNIVARILGTIAPNIDDEYDEDTVLLTARAKYEDFFEGVASPSSTAPVQIPATAEYVTPITRRQLPHNIRTTLLNDFLDHMLGPNKTDYEENDSTIAGGSCIDEDIRQTRQVNGTRPMPRLLLKSLDRPQLRIPKGSAPVSRRSRSTLHDIVDQIVARVSSSASDTLQYPRPVHEAADEDCDSEYDDEGDNSANSIHEISIRSSTSPNTSNHTNTIHDKYTVSSVGRHKTTNGRWKKPKVETMALLDELDDDDDDSLCSSDDSSIVSFPASSFTFDI